MPTINATEAPVSTPIINAPSSPAPKAPEAQGVQAKPSESDKMEAPKPAVPTTLPAPAAQATAENTDEVPAKTDAPVKTSKLKGFFNKFSLANVKAGLSKVGTALKTFGQKILNGLKLCGSKIKEGFLSAKNYLGATFSKNKATEAKTEANATTEVTSEVKIEANNKVTSEGTPEATSDAKPEVKSAVEG